MTSREYIIQLLSEHHQLPVHQLSDLTGISRQRVHRILAELIEQGKVTKLGSPPRVYYQLTTRRTAFKQLDLSHDETEFLEEHFLIVDPLGRVLTGPEGFQYWCNERKLPVEKTVKEYIRTMLKYLGFADAFGLIDGSQKLRSTKELSQCLDSVFYADFYAIERFGKTKLGALLHHAKVSQSKRLIRQIVEMTTDRLQSLIRNRDIKAVGYIPPTLKRDVQIMNELRKGYNLALPHLTIEKVYLPEPVPQKSLKRIEDRILNARSTIIVTDMKSFGNVLLIDDALGSGATMSETACKLLVKSVATKVTGFAVTGSYKGFEVIAEV